MTARIPLRPLLGSALLALLVSPAPADEVSAKDAARAASAWVDRGYAMGRLPAGRTVAGVDEVEDPATGARLLVAKFEGGGFVVLSADDLVDPVLAFSETGDGLDLDERNPFWALLRGDIAAREAAAGVERGGKAATKGGGTATRGAKSAEPTAAQAKWTALLFDAGGGSLRKSAQGVSAISDVRVEPFIQSRWSQDTHDNTPNGQPCYNYFTPGNYVCGCTATALAQIMRYWRYPAGSVARHSYTCWKDGTSGTYEMKGGIYDWDSMPLVPATESGLTLGQRQEIGKLTYDIGVTVNIKWAPGYSGSSLYAGVQCLPTDFGYANARAVNYGYDEAYSLSTLKQGIVANLDARCPCGLSISAPNGGHSVLVDGYGYSDGDFYMHVNMGWAGLNDAWYNPPNFGTSGYAFDTLDGYLFNVFPTNTGSIASGRVLDSTGAPAVGANVALKQGATTVATKTTDANGIYAFIAAPGDYAITAEKYGATGSTAVTLLDTTGTTIVIYDGRRGGYSKGIGTIGNSYGNDVVLSDLEQTAEPVISPPSCLFYPSTNVTISCPDFGASIYYTLDGSTPTTNSIPYTGPIFVSDDVTVKARAFSPGKNASIVVSAKYTYDAVAGGPKGDFFSSPIKISGMNGTYVVADTTDYTLEYGEPNHSGYWEYLSIWYLWTAPGSGTMTFRTYGVGDALDPTAVAVYTGDSLTMLSKKGVASDADDDDPDYATTLEVSVEQGTTYHIVGLVCYPDNGTFTLEWSGDLVVQKTPYELWEEARGVTGGPAGITAGVANVFRYVFDNTNAVFSPILSALPGPSDGSILRLPAVANTNGVTLKVVSTTNLSDWASADVDERKITVGQDGTVTLPVGGPVRFFRLKAIVE